MIDRRDQRFPSWAQLRGLVPYLPAAGLYIVLGVWDPRVLLSWAEGIGFVFIVVWVIPALYRTTRR